jgi:hypothetical protein
MWHPEINAISLDQLSQAEEVCINACRPTFYLALNPRVEVTDGPGAHVSRYANFLRAKLRSIFAVIARERQ